MRQLDFDGSIFSEWERELFQAENELEGSIRDFELEVQTSQKLCDIENRKLTEEDTEREVENFLEVHLICGRDDRRRFYTKFFAEALERIWRYVYYIKDKLLIIVLDIQALTLPLKKDCRVAIFEESLFGEDEKEILRVIYHELAHAILRHSFPSSENEQEANFLTLKWSQNSEK